MKQHSTALRQNNEQNRLQLRKLAIIVKPLTGLNQLGCIIFEAARVGTIMKVVDDDCMVLSEQTMHEFNQLIRNLRQEVLQINLIRQARPKSRSSSVRS